MPAALPRLPGPLRSLLPAQALGLVMVAMVLVIGAGRATPVHAHEEPRWAFLVSRVMERPAAARAEVINHAINQFDQAEGPATAVWQTPQQLVERGVGDCKDFALAKFWLLRHAGTAPGRVRLAYGDVLLFGEWRRHLVVLLWSDDGSPKVLDNLVPGVYRLADRHDLRIQFSFDDDGFYDGAGNRRIRDQPLQGWAGLWSRITPPDRAPSTVATRF